MVSPEKKKHKTKRRKLFLSYLFFKEPVPVLTIIIMVVVDFKIDASRSGPDSPVGLG